jgi:NAD-dependent SIR2 family protein deacetylase
MCLFKKKKLLIIVGAGASVEFDMPSVSDIDNYFDIWSNTIYKVPSHNISLYKYLENEIVAHFNSATKPLKTSTNFEEILYTAMNLYSLNNDNKTNPISAFYNFKHFPQIEVFGKSKAIEHDDFKNLTSYLIDELLKEFRKRCSLLKTTKPNEINTLHNFLTELQNDFEIGVLTFNYDNVFYSQLNSPLTGFNSKGEFDPNIILNNKKWNFIYHLHGSVHFDMQSNKRGLHNVTLNSDLSSTFQQNTSGRSGQTTVEDQYILTSNIIAGYGKSYQIQRNPYYLYFTDFAKKIYEADSLLFAGYGFNDIYINNVISESFDFNRKRPVVVLTYSNNNQDPMKFRTDSWANNLTNTIVTNASTMSTKNNIAAPDIELIKNNKEFEVSKDLDMPLSIWHNGFLEACRNPNLITNELK